MAGSQASRATAQQVREWVRFQAGRVASRPFFLVTDLGDAAANVGQRILWWGERASRSDDRGAR